MIALRRYVKAIPGEDLKAKLAGWEMRYNHERGHMALGGQTPAEALGAKLSTESGGAKVALQAE